MANGSLLERIGRSALDFVFPPRCAGCGADGAFLCDSCTTALEPADPPRCTRCWRPGVGTICLSCQGTPPPFDGLRAAVVYDTLARQLIHTLKYKGVTALAGPLGSLCAVDIRKRGLAFDMVVPVPLHGMKKRTRGYNQAELLARRIGDELQVPTTPAALKRTRRTPPQARSAGIEERLRNVQGAFLGKADLLAGRSALLVDDVTTTGSTLAEAARALKEAGAGKVWAYALARDD